MSLTDFSDWYLLCNLRFQIKKNFGKFFVLRIKPEFFYQLETDIFGNPRLKEMCVPGLPAPEENEVAVIELYNTLTFIHLLTHRW